MIIVETVQTMEGSDEILTRRPSKESGARTAKLANIEGIFLRHITTFVLTNLLIDRVVAALGILILFSLEVALVSMGLVIICLVLVLFRLIFGELYRSGLLDWP
jgi:hypothetical protein